MHKKGVNRQLNSFSKYASLMVMVIGGLGLWGWAFDIQSLKSILPGLATMKANTAICLILAGVALNLKYRHRPSSITLHHASQTCSLIVATLAFLTLGEYIFKQDLFIDQWLFKDLQTAVSIHPGRMSITTALNFALLSVALLTLDHGKRWLLPPAQLLAMIAGAIAFIALIGYLYSVQSLYEVGIYSSMAVHTALGLAALSIGILCARPEQGVMEVVASDTVGGAILRRLLPIALFILIVIGWFRLWGQRAGLYDTDFGLALMVMLSGASLTVVIWLNARWLNRVDAERIKALDSLDTSEERYRRFFENMHEAFVVQEIVRDDDGNPMDLRYLDINPAGEQFLGRTRDELMGRLSSEVSGQPDPESVEMASQVASTGTPAHRFRHSPEFEHWFESFTYSLGSGTIATIAMDITERKRAETMLQTSEECFRLIVDTALDAVIAMDAEGIITEWNIQAEAVFGWSRAEAKGRSLAETIIPTDLREAHRRGLKHFLETGEGPLLNRRIEVQALRRNGETFPAELTITALKIGGTHTFSAFLRDISEHKRIQEVAHASDERFRLAVEAAPSAMIAVDIHGRITLVNQQALQLFGYSREELLGHPIEMLVPGRFRDGHANHRQGFFARPASRAMGAGRDLFGLHKGGLEVPIEIGLTPYETSEGTFTLALIVDITERKQIEEKIRSLNVQLERLVEERTAALRESQDRYHKLFDSIDEGLCIIEMIFDEHDKPVDYRFLEVNPAFEKQTGLIDVQGKSMRELAPDHEEYWFEIYGRIALTGEPARFENRAEALHRWYHVYAFQFGDPKQRQVGILFSDITERKRAEDEIHQLNKDLGQRQSALSEANTLLQTLMDNMPDHIYFKDIDSRFIRNSRSQARMMGLNDPDQVIGRSDFDFFPHEHANRSYKEEQGIITTGQPLLDIEERVVWLDGRVTWVSTTKLPLRDSENRIVGTFGISRDITERKKTEEQLGRANAQLEATNKELEAFSYSVSHDLRAPLRTIDGFSQAVMDDYGQQLPPEAQDYLGRIRKAAQHMAALIDDLLNLSRFTRAPMKSEPVNLSKFVAEITSELRRAQPDRKVKLMIAPGLKAHGDIQLVRVVLENLLNNAWKFSSKKEQAEIEFGSKQEGNQTVYFVRDNGAGFDMAYANKLFGAFQRLHAMTDFPGTGVGLATVQRIINRHGGRIWAEGELGQGATFFFSLPVPERVKLKTTQKTDSIESRAREII